ncbi:MAG: hypothetical protein IJC26_04330 [Clostridia bacterium]|nr:hypothetical protein [Clostridia bacterium]
MKLPERVFTNNRYYQKNTVICPEDFDFYDPLKEPFSLHGLMIQEDGAFRRMPWEIANAVSPKVYSLSSHTSGGRLRFVTDSACLALQVEIERLDARSIMSLQGSLGFDVYLEKDGKEIFWKSVLPSIDTVSAYVNSVPLPEGEKQITLYFPLYNDVKRLKVGLSHGASLKKAKPYEKSKPILFYGSSITQGACASRPGISYVARIARSLSSDFINLGFAGACKGEKVMADYLATIDASVFVLDYDHNSPNPEFLSQTHYGVYQTYRNQHPDTPIVLVTRPASNPLDPSVIGRRSVVMDTYLKAKAAGDQKILFVDGFQLLDDEERMDCTVDGVHPNDYGFYRMAKIIGAAVRRAMSL